MLRFSAKSPRHRLAAALAALALLAAPAAAQAPASTASSASLPGGASSLQETYEDWMVACQIVDQARRCAVSQQQVRQNGQRVVALELRQGTDGNMTGSLILPFGLLLDNGATLAIDDQPPGPAQRFMTCVPGGCLVPLTFEAPMLKSLRAGMALKVQTTSADGPPLPLTLSLKGFAAAIDRLTVLIAS